MFDLVKSIFSAFVGKSDPSRGERTELADIAAQIDKLRENEKAIEGNIAQLQSVMEAGASADLDLVKLATDASGPAGLAAFSSGADVEISRSFDQASRLVQAASVARRALPAVEKQLADVRAAIERLEAAKVRKRAAVMLAHGDRLARKYADTFRELAGLHDQLVGFARGCSAGGYGDNVVLINAPFEVPRFGLPATPAGDTFSPYLRHAPNSQTIAAAALAWSRFGAALVCDPYADVAVYLSPTLAEEVGGHPEHHAKSIIRHPQRVRAEPASARETLFGGPRERPPMRIIGSPASAAER